MNFFRLCMVSIIVDETSIIKSSFDYTLLRLRGIQDSTSIGPVLLGAKVNPTGFKNIFLNQASEIGNVLLSFLKLISNSTRDLQLQPL
jgi:hypothetical protein